MSASVEDGAPILAVPWGFILLALLAGLFLLGFLTGGKD